MAILSDKSPVQGSERWCSVEEISGHLGVAPDTIYRWISAGKIPGHRIGRLWKFKISEVDAWVLGEARKQGRKRAGKR